MVKCIIPAYMYAYMMKLITLETHPNFLLSSKKSVFHKNVMTVVTNVTIFILVQFP